MGRKEDPNEYGPDRRQGSRRPLAHTRPPANAIDETLLDDLSAALDDVRKDDAVRAAVITGAGRFFSGGLDLAAASQDEDFGRLLLDHYREAHLRLLTLPKPTIAMVNGHAIAGGLVTALACDFRTGLDGDYRIGLNEVAIGASFPKIAFEIVRLRLTHARASELLLGAALYSASDALRLGVVDQLIPPAAFEADTLRRAAQLGAYPREAYARTKAALLAEAVSRVEAETDEQATRGVAVWMAQRALPRAHHNRRSWESAPTKTAPVDVVPAPPPERWQINAWAVPAASTMSTMGRRMNSWGPTDSWM